MSAGMRIGLPATLSMPPGKSNFGLCVPREIPLTRAGGESYRRDIPSRTHRLESEAELNQRSRKAVSTTRRIGVRSAKRPQSAAKISTIQRLQSERRFGQRILAHSVSVCSRWVGIMGLRPNRSTLKSGRFRA